MAEIPVEKKSSMKWLWILLLLLLAVLLIWWIAGEDEEEVDLAATETELVDDTATDTMMAEAGILSAILANPQEYVGRDDIQFDASVAEVPTDRGFWVTSGDARVFALIVDEPREVPKDINPGQQLSVSQAMVRDADTYSDVAGTALDQDTQNIVDNQDVFLVVDEDNIQITEAGNPQPGTSPAQTAPTDAM